MPMLFKRSAGWKWLPDSDDTNADDSVLLRADNTIPDRLGSRSLRWGSNTLYSRMNRENYEEITSVNRVHSTYSAQLGDDKFVFNGVGDNLFINGGVLYRKPNGDPTTADDPEAVQHVEPSAIDFSQGGSQTDNDIAMGDDSYQAFFARGKTAMKFDGKRIYKWGIPAPQIKPQIEAVDAITLTIGDFNASETTGNDFVMNEGDQTYHKYSDATPDPPGPDALKNIYVPNYENTADKAMGMKPDSKGRASCTKTWDADVDMLNFKGNLGGQTDLFDIRSWLEEPRKVDRITIMFGLDEGDDPFLDNYYYFDFLIRNNGTVNLKDPNSNAAAAYAAANKKWLSPLTPNEATAVKSPEEASRILRSIGRFAGIRSRERSDSQAASPAWGHFSVTRGQFNRIGVKKGRDWTTVRGFKVVYTAVPGSTEKIYLDDAIWNGGGMRALTGTFQVGYRWARQVKDKNGGEVYTELSPMSPISDQLLMKQQTMRVTISSAAITAKDEQVNQVWVYMYGGNLDTYYRVGILNAGSSTGMKIDDVSAPNNFSNVWAWWKGSILTSHGFSYTDHKPDKVEDLVASVYRSEIDAMTENVIFEPGATGPPNRIISIAGPWNRRIFCLTEEGWLYPSTNTSPSSFSLYQTIDLRMYGTPYWVVKTVSGIFVGCSKDIIRINGSGDTSDDGVTADLWPQPLMVSHPPTDYGVTTDGNSVLYRSLDGPMLFQGASSEQLPFAGTSLLWRGESRHGVLALSLQGGRFRFCEYQHRIYMLAPEGASDPTALWRWDEGTGEWCRFIYYKDEVARTLLSIHADIQGRLLIGTSDGELIQAENGDGDDSAPIPINVLTPLTEGESPMNRKEPCDLQLHVLTGGNTGFIQFFLDRNQDADKIISFSTSSQGIYRDSLLDMDPFLRLQVGIVGSFMKFNLHALGVSYLPRPNHVYALNLGKIIPEKGADLAWVNQVEIEACSTANLLLDVYKNGVLHSTETVVITPNERDMYTVVPPRDTKARRLGMVLRTSNPAGEGFVGFECWMIRVRHAATGNVTELDITAGDIRSDE